MVKLAIVGCMGRMGQRITELALKDPEFQITALIENPNRPDVPDTFKGIKVSKDINDVKGADVLIDFTLPEATMLSLDACVRHQVRMIIGTTGFSPDEGQLITRTAQKIAIVRSTNMSVGVNLVFGMLKKAAEALKGYRVSITETHHIHKKDAPSGTAKTMAEIVEEVTHFQVDNIQSVREGEVIGYHKVTFDSDVDTIEIAHNAKTRDMFAEGALVAAKFIVHKSQGVYNMQQVLGLA